MPISKRGVLDRQTAKAIRDQMDLYDSYSHGDCRSMLDTIDALWALKENVDMVIKHRSSESWADLKKTLAALSEGGK